jgi:chromosome segregation ATPase
MWQLSERDLAGSGSDEESESYKAVQEQQRIADVFRAQAKLVSLKAFRVNNEKMYRDKEFQEIQRKEIQQPLEEAQTIIEVLEGKIARRDVMIRKLQKYISVDLMKGQQSMEDVRARVMDINQTDEQNQLVLMDTITELQKVIETQTSRIAHCQNTMQQQWEKLKTYSKEFEMVEFSHKELIRQTENDRRAYEQLSEAKENKLQDLLQVRQTLEGHVERLDHEVKDTLLKFRESQSHVLTLQEAAKAAEVEHAELREKHVVTEASLAETQEHLTELQERHTNLRTRYLSTLRNRRGCVQTVTSLSECAQLHNSVLVLAVH